MAETKCPHCGNDLTGETGLGITIDVAETIRYSAVLKPDDCVDYANGFKESGERIGQTVRTLCGRCYEEVDAVPLLDGEEV